MVRASISHALILLALLAATAAVYAPLRAAPFVFEDENWMPELTEPVASTPLTIRPSRTLTHATFRWTYDHFNLAPAPWHLTNVGLHLVNGVLVYAVTATVATPLVALGAASLFLVHPLNSEAVSYVTGRTDLLATMFVLLAVLTALSTWHWALRASVCLGLLVCAWSSKEMGIVGGPLVLLAVWRWQRPRVPRLVICASAIGVGIYVGAMWGRFVGALTMVGNAGGSFLAVRDYAVLQVGMIWKYMVMALWPIGQTIDHDALALGPVWLALSAAGCVLVLIAAWALWRRWPTMAWSITWVVVALAPRLVVRTSEFITEPQMYLALIGVWIGLSSAAIGAWNALMALDRDGWSLCHEKERCFSAPQVGR